jgi:hypothetical protein
MTRLVVGDCRRLAMGEVSNGFDTQGADLFGVDFEVPDRRSGPRVRRRLGATVDREFPH